MAGPTGRPLPVITEENEFFWTSGADGRLRLTECESCSALLHPPQPVCRYCRGHETGVRAVSGYATLIGFTVNHRFSAPGMPAPYVVAQVAVEEDTRVRLTTNLVECDPDELELGMRLEVVFEQVEDVWFPLFRPAAEQGPPAPLPSDEVEPEHMRRHIRPMATPEKFEDKVAISGIGMSEIGRRLMVPPLSLTVRACERAVADAGLTLDDIDGLATYPGAGAYGGFAEGGITALEDALGIRPTWYNGGAETFGPGGSLIAAMLAVAGGLARHVLCFRTVWEASYGELIRRGRITQEAGRRVTGWQKPFGAISAAHTLAQNAQRHFHRYGTSRETLGWIALNQRANAALNPTAIYRDPMTMDDYLSARTVTTPSGCTTATCPATDRWPSSCRPWTPHGTSRGRPFWWRPSVPRSWSGSNGTRAPSPMNRRCSASPPTCGRARHCVPRTSTWPSSTTASPSTACPGSRGSASAASVRPRTSSTEARTSPGTDCSR